MKQSRKEKAQITKQTIFENAVSLINKKGYHNVTVSEICKQSGVAKGSFYVHYNSKEDIVKESYYSEMNDYVTDYFFKYLHSQKKNIPLEQIEYFLFLELEFADYVGYELTCLAYSLNLGECVPGPSSHLEKRTFSTILFQLIAENNEIFNDTLTTEEIYNYLESLVRGLMATWCFSNGTFNLLKNGRNIIRHTLNSVSNSS